MIFAGVMAEGRGKALAVTLRATKSEARVRVLAGADGSPAVGTETLTSAPLPGKFVHVAAAEIMPEDAQTVCAA